MVKPDKSESGKTVQFRADMRSKGLIPAQTLNESGSTTINGDRDREAARLIDRVGEGTRRLPDKLELAKVVLAVTLGVPDAALLLLTLGVPDAALLLLMLGVPDAALLLLMLGVPDAALLLLTLGVPDAALLLLTLGVPDGALLVLTLGVLDGRDVEVELTLGLAVDALLPLRLKVGVRVGVMLITDADTEEVGLTNGGAEYTGLDEYSIEGTPVDATVRGQPNGSYPDGISTNTK
jgi:hypothetical protein